MPSFFTHICEYPAMALFGVHRLDSPLSMGIAIYLIYASGRLVAETLSILMRFTPPHLYLVSPT